MLVQRFTLLHDGSSPSWQAAYLSFQIAARLGALLEVLIINKGMDSLAMKSQVSEIEVGARAAGVEVRIRLIKDSTSLNLRNALRHTNNLLVPAHMTPDSASVKTLLDDASCPVWILSKDMAIRTLAIITESSDLEDSHARYVTALSQRLQYPLTILIQSNMLPTNQIREGLLTWFPLSNFSVGEITSALNKIDPSLFFIPASQIHLIGRFMVNYVVYPVTDST